MLKKILIILIITTWPLSLFLTNTFQDFIHYIIPAILVLISFYLSTKKYKYFFAPLFLIVFIEPKFALLPFLFLLLTLTKEKIIPLILSLFLLILFLKPFYGQSIFTFDYQKEQQIIHDEKLYPDIFLARLFQNKLDIPLGKFENNFFALTDPGNYFFGFAPRQIKIDNQNLKKFPFLSLPFLLIGLYFVFKNKNSKFLIPILLAIILNLSLLTNFDRNDFILLVPISILTIDGLNIFDKKILTAQASKYTKYYYAIYILFSFIEILRIFILKS